MEMSNEQMIPAPRDQVWKMINDPEVLKLCIAGCEELEQSEDGVMTATVLLKLGPVKARFKGHVRFEDVVAPQSLKLAGEGSGGVAGHARGAARVTLTDRGQRTLLKYEADAQVGGKIAQLGTRLVQSTANKLAKQFFDRFEEEVVARTTPAV